MTTRAKPKPALLTPPARAAYDVTSHLDWAAGVARQVARRWQFGVRSQEADDVVSVVHLALLRAAGKFRPRRCPPGGDVGELFRGFCHRDLVSEAGRECRRLINGGAYHTRRERAANIFVGRSFTDMTGRSGAAYDVADAARDDVLCEADPPARAADDERPVGSRSAVYAV